MKPTHSVFALLALAATACLGQGSSAEDLGAAQQSIIGGTPTSGDPAVMMLVSYPADKSTFDACTASLVTPTVLLTAAHCVDPTTHPGYIFGVFTGPDASDLTTAALLAPNLVAVQETALHPEYDSKPPFFGDVGVVILKDALAVELLPVQQKPLDASIAGAEARIVGYGQLVYKELNLQKHEATTVVAALDALDTITVGDVSHKSCVGDSGGPALVQMDGVETIVGVDSYADTAGCLEPAHYRRPDVFGDFLSAYMPWGTGSGGAGGAGGAEGQGGDASSAGGGAASSSSGSTADSSSSDDGGCSLSPGAHDGKLGLALAVLGWALLSTKRRSRALPSIAGYTRSDAAAMPNMRRNVRLKCAESAKPARCAASVSEVPEAKLSVARMRRSHSR